MRNFRLLLFTLLLSAMVQAQNSSIPLNLKDCIRLALRDNLSNSIYQNQISIAENQKMEALAGYLPQVNGLATFDDNIKRQVTVIPAGAFSPVDLKVQFGNQFNSGLMVQADQVIFDKSMLVAIKANEPNIEIAEYKKQKNDDDLIYSTATFYYMALGYKEQIKLLAENEKKLSDLLTIQKLQYEKGVITRVTLNRVQVNLNNVISLKKVAETNYSLSLSRLKNTMGIPVGQNIQIVDTLNYQQDVLAELPAMEEFNIQRKPDYLILDRTIKLQELDLKRKQSAIYPTLSAYARYGALAFGNEFSHVYKQLYDYSAIGLKLNVPIFSGLRRHSQIKQSELNLYNTRQNLELNAENLKLQIQSAQTQVLSSYTNLQSNKNNIVLAKMVFEDTSLQFEKGTASLTDFLNSDYAYKEAQTNYINSLLNYLTARIELERAKGTIQEFVHKL